MLCPERRGFVLCLLLAKEPLTTGVNVNLLLTPAAPVFCNGGRLFAKPDANTNPNGDYNEGDCLKYEAKGHW